MAPFDLPIRLFLASALCALLASAPMHPLVRAVGATPLVLYLPGRCLMAAAFPRASTDGETRVLSAALSLACVTLIGLILDGAHALGPLSWVRSLIVVCTVGCCVCATGLGLTKRAGVAIRIRAPLSTSHIAALVAGAGLAGFAYYYASLGALSQRPDLYTDLWMVPAGSPAPGFATVGVRNLEGRDATYAVDIVARGQLIRRIPPFDLGDGADVTFRIALPSVTYAEAAPERLPSSKSSALSSPVSTARAKRLGAEQLRIEARLYKDGTRDTAYRKVWAALPLPRDTAVIAAGNAAETVPAGDLAFTGAGVDSMRTVAVPNRASLFTPASVSAATAAAAQTPSSAFDATRVSDARTHEFRTSGAENIAQDLRAESADVVQSLRAAPHPPRASGGSPSPSLE